MKNKIARRRLKFHDCSKKRESNFQSDELWNWIFPSYTVTLLWLNSHKLHYSYASVLKHLWDSSNSSRPRKVLKFLTNNSISSLSFIWEKFPHHFDITNSADFFKFVLATRKCSIRALITSLSRTFWWIVARRVDEYLCLYKILYTGSERENFFCANVGAINLRRSSHALWKKRADGNNSLVSTDTPGHLKIYGCVFNDKLAGFQWHTIRIHSCSFIWRHFFTHVA